MRIQSLWGTGLCVPLSGTSHNSLVQASTTTVSLMWWATPSIYLSALLRGLVAYPCGRFLFCLLFLMYRRKQRPPWLVAFEPPLLPHCALGIRAMASMVPLEFFCV